MIYCNKREREGWRRWWWWWWADMTTKSHQTNKKQETRRFVSTLSLSLSLSLLTIFPAESIPPSNQWCVHPMMRPFYTHSASSYQWCVHSIHTLPRCLVGTWNCGVRAPLKCPGMRLYGKYDTIWEFITLTLSDIYQSPRGKVKDGIS